MVRIFFALFIGLCFSLPVHADGPKDNIPEKVRQIPPPGIKISDKDRQELQAGVEKLKSDIAALKNDLKKNPKLHELIPDVQIFSNAVYYALKYDEFYNKREIPVAHKLLKLGHERADRLRQGKAPWLTATGLIPRGYVSKIDGSVQPYGLVVPPSYQPGSPREHRLDLWYHGRGEKLSEVSFLNQRLTQPGRFTPKDTIVLHPYGRYSNANHFAGEIDTFEALDHVKKYYPIDENRIVVRGFSMGGAACWNFAVHYSGMWAAAAPGAGFSETPEFLRVFQKEEIKPTWYERKLLHMYDCTDWAINLSNCPTVAYSGEIDRQKQAADIMAEAMAREGLDMVHIIGPKTGHTYHPEAKKEIDRRIDAIARIGRNPIPKRVQFTTFTLRYNKMHWVTVDALEEHWERARVDAMLLDRFRVSIKTTNVTALTLTMPPGSCPLDNTTPPVVLIDGEIIKAAPVKSDRSWNASFHWTKKGWTAGALPEDKLRKRHGLQGPIDDAFMDSFVMVQPTGKANDFAVAKWVFEEKKHAIEHWRKQFRAELKVKKDTDISDEDIRTKNLILWGDPSSNKVLGKILKDLPLKWDGKTIRLGNNKKWIYNWTGSHLVPAMIFPNPLNPKKYVVLNSCFTYREYDYLNNARQVPKLPDWAIYDINVPGTSQRPAAVVEAGFFDENWEVIDKKD